MPDIEYIAGFDPPLAQLGYGLMSSVGFPPAPTFFAQLQTNLLLNAGTGSATFTRATTAYVSDFESLLKQAISGEARFTGARRVANRCQRSENVTTGGGGWTAIGTATTPDSNTVTLAAVSDYVRAGVTSGFGASNETITISFEAYADTAFNIAVTANDTGAWSTYNTYALIALTASYRRYSVTLSRTAGTSAALYVIFGDKKHDNTSAGATIGTFHLKNVQIERVTGQSNQNPSEYVSVGVTSAPYHGAGVDGVAYFSHENGNVVS